jgi:hypothetical protein
LGYKLYSGHTYLDQWAKLPVKPHLVTWLRDRVLTGLVDVYFLAISVRTDPNIEEEFADFNFVANILGPGVGTPIPRR